MNLDLAALAVPQLFRDPRMFDSAKSWKAAGFAIVRASKHRMLVAKHASVNGYLFKKYPNSVPLNEQIAKYTQRVEGAQKLREFVTAKGLQRISVPQKQLCSLPPQFSPLGGVASYILVVEEMPILNEKASKKAHEHIDETTLRELCTVFFAFERLDFTAQNAPFTKTGTIAFIDTAHANYRNPSNRKYLTYAKRYLSGRRWKLAEKIFEELEARIN